MKHYKLIITGSALMVVSMLALTYNFTDLYTFVGVDGKCTAGTSLQSCAAYESWIAFNIVGLIAFVIGIAVLVTGLLCYFQHKS